MAEIGPMFIKDFSSGMISDVNSNLAPKSSSTLLLNLEADVDLGSLVSRLGTARIGSQLVSGKSVLGICQHVDQASVASNKLFAAISNSGATQNVIYDVEAGTTSLTGDTVALKTYFLNYNGDTLRLNGTDAPKAYNSSSWITTGGVFDLANMPTGYKYAMEFLDRVYLWGKASSPYTLAYSGVLTGGAVSFTSGNGTVEIEPEDNGGEATGLGKVPGYLLLFKRRSLHRFNYSSAFPEALVNIGAYSQESIVCAGGLCAFYSDSNEGSKGFYITDGRRPQPISHDNARPIKKWVDAISSSGVVSGWATERYFCWSVGDLTVDNETYNNVVLKYNRILNQWTVRTYPSEFKCFCPYVVGGVHTTVGGDDNGTVYRVDKAGAYTDANTSTTVPIPFKLRTPHHTWGFNQLKTLTNQIIVRGKNIPNLTINAIVNEDVSQRISLKAPSIFAKLLAIFNIGTSVRGNTICAEVMGETTGNQAYIREIEFPSISIDNTYA